MRNVRFYNTKKYWPYLNQNSVFICNYSNFYVLIKENSPNCKYNAFLNFQHIMWNRILTNAVCQNKRWILMFKFLVTFYSVHSKSTFSQFCLVFFFLKIKFFLLFLNWINFIKSNFGKKSDIESNEKVLCFELFYKYIFLSFSFIFKHLIFDYKFAMSNTSKN